MVATSPLSGQPPVISLDVLVAFEEAGGSFRDPDSAVALPGEPKGYCPDMLHGIFREEERQTEMGFLRKV